MRTEVMFIWLKVFFNLWRTTIAYTFLKTCKFNKKFEKDLYAWKKNDSVIADKNDFMAFSYICFCNMEFRNVFLNRLHRNPLKYIIVRILFRPLDSLYINMPPENIGGGLYFKHGFSTIVAAKEIGENCTIYQQCTIGFNDNKQPVIKSNVKICAGSIVIGDVVVNDNTIIGAGSVVTKNIEKDSIVAGVPAKKIKNNTEGDKSENSTSK